MKNLRTQKRLSKTLAVMLATTVSLTALPLHMPVLAAEQRQVKASGVTVEETTEGYRLSNDYFIVETGKYGNIHSLQIKNDLYPTNYVLNAENAAAQASAAGHQWMGELMFKVKSGDAAEWSEQNTGRSDSGRKVELVDNQVVVTYENATEEKGIKDFKVVETYSLEDSGQLRWEITVTNTKEEDLVIGDFGVPLAFNEYWPGGEEIYETRTVDHSFVGKNSSYIYVTRPSGLGQFLVMTPDVSTGAGFEYQDHWRAMERAEDEKAWCQDESGWANGLNVFYIHSDVIKSTNRGYLDNTSLTLKAGESKTYAFNFSVAEDEADMKSILYKEGIIDAVAVPGMAYSVNMPGKMYLHTDIAAEDISFEIACPHETGLHEGNPNTVSNFMDCVKTETGTYVKYAETKNVDGEQYHIYDIKFEDLGQNHVIVNYEDDKQTVLQFYMMDEVANALETHSDFMVEKTQMHTPGETGDKVFDDWMMDTKQLRADTDPTYWEKNYWGWGDDWGLTHGTYIAEKNVYQPVAKEIEAVDDYLDIAIWNGLMREHQKDYKIHDFLMVAPNTSPDGRGYAYPHIYNTYFSMYKIAKKYPDMVEYIEDKDTYLLRAYNILKALYGEGVGYNWETGLMGELTTPAIISALREEGYYAQAQNIEEIMSRKYANFKNTKYPYGSEYTYDNTGEEAVYTLAKVNLDSDTENASAMMDKINAKTRACRGVQPVWYHYANPTTICGENWWNFQYTASLAGYCMDDWLRLQENGMSANEISDAARVNYAAKLVNLTCINSGQIDADQENIGAISWTYQSEMGNLGGQGTGEGYLHNGWRQMAGEADLGLFGALQILSSDVTEDNVFGLFGYGCEVTEEADAYTVTPLDGLFTKLNFIHKGLYIELMRDQYTQAVVGTDNASVKLSMKNIEQTAHDTEIDFTGLAAGSYQVRVDGTVIGSFQAVEGETSTVAVALPAAETAEVEIVKGEALENQKPVVDAGEDITLQISENARLEGNAADDGYVNAALTYTWEVVSTPEGGTAVIANPDKRISDVSFDKTGEYTFKLTVDDGEYQESDTVVYTVTENAAKPEIMADYNFETISEDNRYVVTTAGKDYWGTLTYSPSLTEGKGEDSKGLQMTGKISGGYLELPHILTELVDNATVVMDVYLNGTQLNHTTLFRFGEDCVVEFVNGNEVALTVNGNTQNTGVELAAGYWKNIALTAQEDDFVLYIDGVKYAELKDTGLVLEDIAEEERYFIGRGLAETDAFLNAVVDNFVMKSIAMPEEEVKEIYGNDEIIEIVTTKEETVVTSVGEAPKLPETVSVLYSDGIYRKQAVVWDTMEESAYQQSGSITVNGKIEGTDMVVTVKVVIVAGTLQNIAPEAKATAIFEDVSDLGGAAAMNDGNDPANSADLTNGGWHNWNGGNQGGPAWVRYDWEEAQMISKMDIYFFKDSNGNFAPANYSIEYLDGDGNWQDVTQAQGYGVEIDTYNTTTFAPVLTTAIRVTMRPAALGCGVLEWKVYGYKDGNPLDRKGINAAIRKAESLKADVFTAGMENVTLELAAAYAVKEKKNVTQEELDTVAKNLYIAILKLTPLEKGNIAYAANVAASYVSDWETTDAVNDGIVYDNQSFDGQPHYGTWGNTSDRESVTYTWGVPVTITSSDIYFWTDGGGILVPKAYVYEYLDSNGEWQEVSNAQGYKITDIREGETEESLNGFNTTTFDTVTTTAFRVTIHKPSESYDGVGIIEWRVFGELFTEPDKPQQTPDTEIPDKPQQIPDTETPDKPQQTPDTETPDTKLPENPNENAGTSGNTPIATAPTKESILADNPGLPTGKAEESKNAEFGKLKAMVKTSKATSNKLQWSKVTGADGYVVFGNKCNTKGKKYAYEVLSIIENNKTTTFTHKKLSKAAYYKYIVQAYKMVDGKVQILTTSKTIHAATKSAKYANVKKVKVNKSKVVLAKKGKTFKIKPTVKKTTGKKLKNHRGIKFESDNKKVAVVNTKGVITAKKKGTCTIYVYAQNGVYAKVTVKVKK